MKYFYIDLFFKTVLYPKEPKEITVKNNFLSPIPQPTRFPSPEATCIRSCL